MTQLQQIQISVASQLTTEQQEQLKECGTKLLAVIDQYPGIGVVALAMIGAKLSGE